MNMNKLTSSCRYLVALLLWTMCPVQSIMYAQNGTMSSAPMATAVEDTLSFWDIPELNEAYFCAAPHARKDGIVVGKLGKDGGNKSMILQLAQEIANDNDDQFDSFLINHEGKLLFESYYSKGRLDLPHPQASATKVYTSFALGRAIQMGYLTMDDLEKPLVSFFDDLDLSGLADGAENITLHKALTMCSGLRISKDKQEDFRNNPDLLRGQGQVQVYLGNSEPITTDSQQFKYQFDPIFVIQVIEAVVPGSAKDFIKEELLDKLGIMNYRWETDISGLPGAGAATSMTSRDMIKWGMLARNKGKWNGEQLISEEFLAKAMSRILLTGDDDVYGGGKDVSKQGYGYYWWSADLKVGDKSYFCLSAQGGGGQYIIWIEELDLIVVVTAHENDNSTLQMIAERVIPAFN